MYGECLKKIRKGLGLNQTEFGDKVDISQTHLSQIESGLKMPSRELLENISFVFDIPMGVIYLSMAKEEELTHNTRKILHKYEAVFETLLNEFLVKNKKIENGLYTEAIVLSE